jgi:pentatricopeptide repeat protein
LLQIATYNALLKALRAGGLTGQAFATIEDLRARGLKPDVVTFNTLLDAAGEAGNDTLMALVREDMRKAGIARDAATFNTEIKRCARTKVPIPFNPHIHRKHFSVS